jgi:hypothetical protein
VRRDGGGRLGGEREEVGSPAGTNFTRRAADWRSSGEKFRSRHCGSSGEAKGERERTARGLYSFG